jgi:tetratricopeptide (TPR) repeat protein
MNRKKQSNLKTVISRRQLSEFVGRAEELAVFRENLTRSWDDDQRIILFNVWGQGGIGKTTLLSRFMQLGLESGTVTARTDEGQTDIPAVMARFVEQLKEQNHELKEFEERYKVYRQKREELEADPSAPQGFTTFAARVLTKTGIHLARRAPVAGVVFDLLDDNALANQVGDWVTYAARKLGNKDEVRLVLEPTEVLTPIFLEGLQDIADKQTIILFFDTYERTSSYLDDWLCNILDGHFGDVPADILLVIAGREELDRNQWMPYAGVIARFPLEPFTEEEARQYLNRKRITNEQVVDVILKLSGRFPLLVATLASESPDELIEINDPGSTAITRFLKWVPDPERQQTALNAALPRRFNRDVLAKLVEERDVDELFNWLRQMPFVQERAEGWVYHEVVRMQMLRHKRRESPETWAILHGRLSIFYSNLCASLNLEAKKAWRDADWQEYALQKLYHELCQSPQTQLVSVLNDFLDALKANLDFARRWAATLQQVGHDIDNDNLVEWGNKLISGLRAYDEDRYDETLGMFSSLLAYPEIHDNERAIALGWRGRVHQLNKQYIEALNDFNAAIRLDPENIWAITYRGVNYMWMDEFGEALPDLNRAIELDQKSVLALATRGEYYMRLGPNDAALADLNQAIEVDPKSTRALRLRGMTYANMKRYTEALADLNRALEIDPRDQYVLSRRGILYREMGKDSDAVADFDRLVELDSRDPWNVTSRGENFRLLKRHDEALADFDQAIRLDPKYTWAIEQRAWLYMELEKSEEALASINQAIEFDPNYVSALGTRAIIYWRAGRYEEALLSLDKGIKLDPKKTWLMAHRGLRYRLLGRYEEALSDLNKATALDPQFAWPFAERGFTYLHMKQYEKALEDLNHALQIDPEADWWHYIRALIYQAQGRSAEADVDFSAAIQTISQRYEKNPKDSYTAFYAAVYHLTTGQLEVARGLYQNALALGPSLSVIREVKDDLDDLLVLLPEHNEANAMRAELKQYMYEKSGL